MHPLLFVPLKRAALIDFGPAFSNHITEHYQEDSRTYASQIAQLNKLRADCNGAGRDMSGRDIWYRYYGQLELLDTRFPISEAVVKILFTWSDAFTSEETSQYSIAFEKACTIFNIAGTLSGIAAMQNRSDPVGLKTAFNCLQSAAGLFQYISDNFLHAPSSDLSKESIAVLVDLCLGEAQECFVEKVVSEKKSASLISKLASHTSFLYSSTLEKMSVDALSTQFEKPWVDFVRIKLLYFQSVASMHKSTHLESEQKYGEALSYMVQADERAKEASKISAGVLKKFPTFNIVQSTLPSTIATSLHEMTTIQLALTSGYRKRMTRENDVIYHESINLTPPELERTCVVKCQTFHELFSTKEEAQRIIGPDIFVKLVPLSVHCSASVYSEELNVLYKQVAGECESADQMYSGLVASLGAGKLLSLIKSGDQGEFPAYILSILQDARESDNKAGRSESDEMLDSINKFKIEFKGCVEACLRLIEQDATEDNSKRSKYGAQWTLPTSFNNTVDFRHDLRKFEDAFNTALKTDDARDDSVMRELAVLKQPVRRLEEIMNQSDAKLDLIDVQEASNVNEQDLVKSIDKEMVLLREIKAHRPIILAELKTKIDAEEITQSLILNKGKDQLVFQAELAKFTPLQSKIDQNISLQSIHFQTLTALLESLQKHSPILKSAAARAKKWSVVFENWRRIHEDYQDFKQNLIKGVDFYSNIVKMVSNTQVNMQRQVASASAARTALCKKIEIDQASFEQESMRKQLERLGVSAHNSNQGLALQSTSGSSNQYDRPAMLPIQQQQTSGLLRQEPPSNYAPVQYQQAPHSSYSPSPVQYQQAPIQYQQVPQSNYGPSPIQYQQAPNQSSSQSSLQYQQAPHHPPSQSSLQYQPQNIFVYPNQRPSGYQPTLYQQAQQNTQPSSSTQYNQVPQPQNLPIQPPLQQQQQHQNSNPNTQPQNYAPNRNLMD